MNKSTQHKISTLLIVGSLLPSFALAQGLAVPRPNTGVGSTMDIGQIISMLINTAIGLAGIIFLVMLIIGGYQYFSASGDQAQAQKANKTMMFALIGLVITAIAYPVTNYVAGNILKINNWRTLDSSPPPQQQNQQGQGTSENTNSPPKIEGVELENPQSPPPVDPDLQGEPNPFD